MELPALLHMAPGLPQLFLLAFLAATVLPVGSEWLLVVMISSGWPVAETVVTASIGNFLGSCTTYLLGFWGSEFCRQKLLRISSDNMTKAEHYYHKYGPFSLLLAWLPVIGDPLCFVAGVFRMNFLLFCLLVFIGKFLRYATLAFLTLQGTGG